MASDERISKPGTGHKIIEVVKKMIFFGKSRRRQIGDQLLLRAPRLIIHIWTNVLEMH
jgi:hypothetical protein